jgi:hypothetical protein
LLPAEGVEINSQTRKDSCDLILRLNLIC